MRTPAQAFEGPEDGYEYEEPEFEEPEVEAPEIEEPEIEEPEFEEPEIEEPEIDEPEVDEPEVDEPEVEAPEIEEQEQEADASGEAGDDDANSGDEIGEEGETGGSGNDPSDDLVTASDWLSELAQSQDPEFDRAGFPVRRGEIVALDLTGEALEELRQAGFAVLATTPLPALDAELTTLAVPSERTALDALDLARMLDPAGTYDLGHFYSTPYQPAGQREAKGRAPAPTRPVAGPLRIGLIDTEVRRAAIPRHVSLVSRAFGRPGGTGGSDHGTAVAAILVEYGASELVVANVFDSDGRRNLTSAETISRALGWMLERQVPVVNVSLAGPRNAILETLVRRASARGIAIVAAAGNGGPTAPPAYPAALPDVVAVTAVDASHRVYRYANRGAYVRLASLGVRVPVSLGGEGRSYFTGTSFASPLISIRIAACIRSGSTATTCISRMEQSAQDLGAPGRDEVYGFGLVE